MIEETGDRESADNKANSKQERPKESPPALAVGNEEKNCKSVATNCYAEGKKRDIYDKFFLTLSFLTFIAAAIATVATINVASLTRKTLEGFTAQLTLDHPPRLHISNVVIWEHSRREERGVTLRPDVDIDGRFPLVNVGKGTAEIKKMWCEVIWTSNPLPMYRSFYDNTGNQCGAFGSIPTSDRFKPGIGPRHDTVGPFDMRPGDGAMWEFKTTVPANYTPNMKLWVWGAIQYKDRVSEHSYVFARYYDPLLGRFAPELNSDYEGQETDDKK